MAPIICASRFTYYRVTTEAHDLILADVCAGETYVNYIVEGAFDNESTRERRVIPEMALPRVSSARLVPEHVKRRLAKGRFGVWI